MRCRVSHQPAGLWGRVGSVSPSSWFQLRCLRHTSNTWRETIRANRNLVSLLGSSTAPKCWLCPAVGLLFWGASTPLTSIFWLLSPPLQDAVCSCLCLLAASSMLHIRELRAGQSWWWRKRNKSLSWFFSPPLLRSRLWAGKLCLSVLLTCHYLQQEENAPLWLHDSVLAVNLARLSLRGGKGGSFTRHIPSPVPPLLPSRGAEPLHLSPPGGGLRLTNPMGCSWA